MLNSIVSFLLALGILVFIHEYGHYSVARFYGVRVIRFSVGFGKPIFRWINRKTSPTAHREAETAKAHRG